MKRFVSLLVLLIVVSLPAHALPRKKDRWNRVTTENFTLFSNASIRETKLIGRQIEKLKATLELTSEGLSTRSPLPTHIFVFRNESTFNAYKMGRDGKSENLAGFFAPTHDGNYVAIDISAGLRPQEIIFHEYVHYWLSNNVPAAPLWFNEGLAEYYSTFRAEPSGAEIGRFVTEHVRWLRANELMPMRRLLAADAGSPDYHEEDRVGTFYAQSWALVHYIVSNAERRDQIGAYFQRINKNMDPIDAFRESWGLTPEALQSELAAYVKEGTFPYYKLTFAQLLKAPATGVEPMEYQQVLFRLGDLLAHTPPLQFEAATEHLRAAIAIDESLAPAWATLGYLEQFQGRDEQASELYKKALSLDDEDARSHRLYGLGLLERFEETLVSGFETFEEPPPMLALARSELERALALEPGHPPSLAGLAQTYAYQPDDEQALLVLDRALNAQPSRTDLLLNLIIVTAHRGNLAGAWRLLNGALRARGDTNMIRSAEAIISSVSIEQAFEMAEQGQDEEAIRFLREAADATQNAALRRQLLAQAVSLTAFALDGPDLESYTAAIELANESRFDEAIALLAELIETTEQDQLKLVAETQRESLIEIQREIVNITLYNEAVSLANDQKFAAAAKVLTKLLGGEVDVDLRTESEKIMRQIRQILGE